MRFPEMLLKADSYAYFARGRLTMYFVAIHIHSGKKKGKLNYNNSNNTNYMIMNI